MGFLDEPGLGRLWEKVRSALSGKQDILTGCILMWSGTAEDIPKGWALCDGENGTPDLRGRFVLGQSEAHAPGSTGGSESVALSVAQLPEHTHMLGLNYGTGTGSTAFSWVSSATKVMSAETGEAGGNQPHENMPPYYTLCYIMKL